MKLSPSAAALLAPAAQQLVVEIFDGDLRDQVLRVLNGAGDALAALDRLNLDRFELIDLDLPDLSVWNEAAPAVRDAMVAVDSALREANAAFPATVPPAPATGDLDVDGAFDELEKEPDRAERGGTIDKWVAHDEPVNVAVAALSEMLRREMAKFAAVIRRPDVVSSRWMLLGELQEFQSKCRQCFEAIAAAVLRPLRPFHPELRTTDLMPRYRSELDRSLLLRDSIAELAQEVGSFHRDLVQGARAQEIQARLSARLDVFASTQSYGMLWARDKREIILARMAIRSWDPRDPTHILRERMDGLARFLEVLVSAISRRPEVEAWDEESARLLEALT